MIEAVNAVVATAPLARGPAEQQSVTRSFAANPERVQELPQAPYISPYIFMDVNFDRAILQIRDSDTGDVVRQFPSESQLEAYRRAQSAAPTGEDRAAKTSPLPQESTPSPNTSAPAESAAAPQTPVAEPSVPQAQPQTPAPAATVDTQA